MALQQASLFFNEPPEEPRETQPLPAKKEEEPKPIAEQEAPQEIIEESKPVEIALTTEPLPAPEPIVIDEVVREIELQPAVVEEIESEPVVKREKKEKPAKKTGRGRMRLSDMHVMADLVEVPEDEQLFQKNYYGISEVSNMFKVNISLIRFWENEFDILKPKKNGKGDRLFRPEDIKNLQLIYHLLREKKYTIEGARDFLKKNKKAEETFELIESLKKTKAFLLDLKANL